MKGTFLFLGTGASGGIPVIGCSCAVCTSSSPYNQRLRPSGLVQIGDKVLLLDIGPDFRQQALKYRIGQLDGLLLTHTHYDHIAGIDEVRIFYIRHKTPFPCLLSAESLDILKSRYDYLFRPIGHVPILSAQLDFHLLEREMGEVEFLGLKIGYCTYSQGGTKVTGFRFGNFAYLTDIRDYDPSIFVAVKGVRTLVLSALREEPSPLHLSLDEAVAFVQKAGVHQAYLTHLSHAIDHEKVNQKLPSNVRLGYDGLTFSFEM